MNLYQEVALSFKKVGDPCIAVYNTVSIVACIFIKRCYTCSTVITITYCRGVKIYVRFSFDFSVSKCKL